METQGPRWHIDKQALGVLEACFAMEQFPNANVRAQLGHDLQVSARQIQVWFQNRRQRERKRRESQGGSGSRGALGNSYSTLNASTEEISSALLEFGDEEPDECDNNEGAKRRRLGIPLAPLPNIPGEDAPKSSSSGLLQGLDLDQQTSQKVLE